MVTKRRFLDVKPDDAAATASQLQQADSTLLGTVTELVDATNIAVAIDGVGDAQADVVCPGSGRMWVGARVRCIRDSSGRVVRVEAMAVNELPDGVETQDMDATTQWISWEQSATASALAAAREELGQNQQQLADELAAADQRLTDAATEAAEKYALLDQTRQDVVQVRGTAQGAADLAATTAEAAIVSVVVEYAVGSSETVAPTSGWSTSTPARTPGTFIWSRTTTTKGGEPQTSTTSAPVLVTGNTGQRGPQGPIGPAGHDGADGTSVTIQGSVASASALPTGLGSGDAGKGWMASDTGHLHVWSGSSWTDVGAVRGPAGSTAYVHMAWATSSSGANFSTSYFSGATYMGTYSDHTQADSTKAADYTWALVQGPQGQTGPKGATGATGTGVSSVTTYYALVGQGVAAPAKPTTNPPAAPWSLTEPAYTSNTELYRTDLTVLTSGSWSYGAVSKVSSYTAATQAKGAADQALTAANLAQASAQGLVKMSKTDPGHAVGRIWFVLNATGNVIGMKISNGSAWSSYAIITEDLMVVSANGTVRLKDGVVSGTSIIFDQAFFDSMLVNNDLFAKNLYANRVVVSADNLVPDPTFSTVTTDRGVGTGWDAYTSGTGSTAIRWRGSATAGYFDLMVTRSGSTDSSARWQTCNGGDSYLLTYRVSKESYPRYRWQANYENIDGTRGYVAGPTITAAGSGTATQTWEFTLPATAAKFSIRAYVNNPDGLTGQWVVYGDSLALRRKTGAVLIEDGAVTAQKMAVTQELWAKLASFVKITTDMLLAGNATITNELLVNTLVGKILRGGMVVAGDGASMPTALLGPASGDLDQPGDRFGLYLTTPGNVGGKALLEVTPSGPSMELEDGSGNMLMSMNGVNGMRVRDPRSGNQIALSEQVLGAVWDAPKSKYSVLGGNKVYARWYTLDFGTLVMSPTGVFQVNYSVAAQDNMSPTRYTQIDAAIALTEDGKDTFTEYAWTSPSLTFWENGGFQSFANGFDVVRLKPNQKYKITWWFRAKGNLDAGNGLYGDVVRRTFAIQPI